MESRLGLADLGSFVAGFGISAGLISGFESILSTYFQPGFYRRVSGSKAEEQSAAWLEYAQNLLPALLLTSLFIIAAAPELTQLMLGPSFSQSERFVAWGACAELARISAGVFALAAYAKMDTQQLLLPNLVGAISALMVLGWAIAAYGSDGVGLGLVLSSLLMLLFSIHVTRKRLAIPLPVRGLLRSMFFGVGLLAIAMAMRAWFGSGSGILGTMVQLCALSIPFALFQYQMLRPALKREEF
jgi:O-antigen/teichoic acid export membrane protein